MGQTEPIPQGGPAGIPPRITTLTWTELAYFPRWLAWKLESKPGKAKPDKVPYTKDRRRGNATDPACWGTLAEAERWCKEIGGDGVGLAFGIDERNGIGFGGVDYDHCRDTREGFAELSAIDPDILEIINW